MFMSASIPAPWHLIQVLPSLDSSPEMAGSLYPPLSLKSMRYMLLRIKRSPKLSNVDL